MYLSVYVCERETARNRDRETQRQREKEEKKREERERRKEKDYVPLFYVFNYLLMS